MVPNSVSYCRAEPFKVLAAAPRPRKKGRFRVAISDRSEGKASAGFTMLSRPTWK